MDDSAPGSGGDWVDVGAVEDFAPGEGRQVPLGDLRVAVFRGPGDAFHGLADRCPHAGAPLSAGRLQDGAVVCTWHGWRFDAATGRCESVAWGDAVPTHAVRVADGRVLLSTARHTGG